MPRHTAEALLRELRARGVQRIRRIIFKTTRTVIYSVTARGTTLNLNEAFRSAPPTIVDALAVVGGGPGEGGLTYEQAMRRIRRWRPLQRALDEARTEYARRTGQTRVPRPGRCAGTPQERAELRRLYTRLNATRFAGCLPGDLPVRLSDRMSSRLGHVQYHRTPGRRRVVVEIALNADLMLAPNAAQRLDTLLHEMAHVEAFLFHGEKDHGPAWKEIAERVGCEPRACTTERVVRSRRRRAA